MIIPIYRERVELLIRLIPYIAEEKVFGLKGGTAINLFMSDFPRFSVDIDLVYLSLDNRETALDNISTALNRIKNSLLKDIPDLQITAVPFSEGQDVKLLCQMNRAQVKIEVNTVSRGHVMPVTLQRIAENVEREFELFAAMQVLSDGEVYGSKICAALDRQHPRDLFDVKILLDSQGVTEEIKLGLLSAVLSHPRPIHEVMKPRLISQEQVFESQFQGMSLIPFTYEDHEQTMVRLFQDVENALSNTDREFLHSFKDGEPAWSLEREYELMKKLPAVQWKLLNIKKLKDLNPAKHKEMLGALEQKLFG